MGSNKNKHDIFGCVGLLSQKWAFQNSPPLVLWFISNVRCCSIFIHDVYVDWNVPCINYSPKYYYDHLWDFIWWYASCMHILLCYPYFFFCVCANCLNGFQLDFLIHIQPVLHDWCNKGCGMCYRVCGMMHIKEPLLLIDKSSLCGGSRFPLSLSEWSFTMCMTPYNRK